MTNIEIVIGLLLLLMTVPDGCNRLRRPALAYPAFVLFGFLLGLATNAEIRSMLHQAGMVGFLMLLFEVGLEIDLPPVRELGPAARYAVPWVIIQYPILFLLAHAAGLELVPSLFGAAALTGVSVGMSYPAWKTYPGLDGASRKTLLQILILLEICSIMLLAVGAPTLKTGLSWAVPAKLAGVALVLLLVARFADHLTRLFQAVLERATHWRTHLLVLMVLTVCALGERLGLSAAKTAFFLGLFMSRAEHEGRGLEEFTAPISQRFLIPVFFVSLGLRLEWTMVFSMTGLLALATAAVLLGAREVLHRRWLPLGGDGRTFLLLCPNLPVVALAASTLLDSGSPPEASGWLLLTSLFLTVAGVALLPPTPQNPAKSGQGGLPVADPIPTTLSQGISVVSHPDRAAPQL